jgi:cell shape-determining protein MreD
MYDYNQRQFFNSTWNRITLYVGLIFLISIIQIYFLDIIKIQNILPDFLVILTCWITLREGVYIGLILSFFAGIIHDFFALNPLGFTGLCLLVSSFSLKFLKSRDNYPKDLYSIRFVLFTFLAALVANSLKLLLSINIFVENIEMYFFEQIVGICVYTSIFAFFPVAIKFRSKPSY